MHVCVTHNTSFLTTRTIVVYPLYLRSTLRLHLGLEQRSETARAAEVELPFGVAPGGPRRAKRDRLRWSLGSRSVDHVQRFASMTFGASGQRVVHRLTIIRPAETALCLSHVCNVCVVPFLRPERFDCLDFAPDTPSVPRVGHRSVGENPFACVRSSSPVLPVPPLPVFIPSPLPLFPCISLVCDALVDGIRTSSREEMPQAMSCFRVVFPVYVRALPAGQEREAGFISVFEVK